MPIIGGHKTLSSFLHLSGSNKVDGRTAFSPYTGSLSDGGPANGRDAAASETETMVGTPSMNFGTSITLNVRYVAKDMWKKVTFPPGITVTQARDICMLRFNVWQQTLTQEEIAGNERSNASGSSKGAKVAPPIMPPGSQGSKSQPELREQYGLFWTSAGHWLEADEMLNAYPLRKGEVLELQHMVEFIQLQPHEFKHSYTESFIYYLQPDSGAESNWQFYWTVLRGRVLRLYRRKGQQDADIEIDLSRPFRLIDQDGRSWPRNSKSSGSSGSDTSIVQSLLENLPKVSGNHGGTGGGMLIVQTVGSGNASTTTLAQAAAQTHAFCTCDVFDYEVWHRTLRHTQSAGVNGGSGGSSMSASASISGASNNSSGVPQPDTPTQHSMHTSDTAEKSGGALSMLSPQMTYRFRPSSTRHEGYVNRKSPHGYGFRRRYCVLLPTALYGFIHADDCKGVADEDLLAKSEFAMALDPSAITVEAIAWNGRFLLRVFGPDSRSLRDNPAPASMQTETNMRAQCTDILAIAAQAAIEQQGSTFGTLPDARELVRLMIDNSEEGQTWAVGFNSIAGLQITGQSKVIISARRTNSLAESKSLANLKTSPGANDYHTMPAARSGALPATLDEQDEYPQLPSGSAPTSGRQQSLSEFIVSQMDPISGRPVQQQQQQQQQQQVSSPPPPPAPQAAHGPVSGLGIQQHPNLQNTTAAESQDDGKQKPKWIPLSIDKYIKEEEEKKRHQGYEGGIHATASRSSGGPHALQSKPSNVSDNDDQPYSDYSSSHGSRPPARFNWFKRRGSTSK
ncbi:hypothetical protein LPJ78_003328 [Coemansia sp. RSA 989]|nr:hypothetical protein LPJ68_002380 [Coemansia sp. RSA 1086]KAJ1864521.1 hypothetical protein LPJ78_003328 [Coemansia sp. RSA 989]KAJ1871990.1 hypothetical protein LPJ55_003439 [Coemansia sp. RSA 990]KAJ2670087.1 hypothetical protein IWW42_004163 [Coemansia sp. RSA 1085]